METLLVLIFIFYFFSSRRITDDIFSINKHIAKSFCNVFLSFFRFLLNPIKSWFTGRKKTISSNEGKKSANINEYKKIVDYNKANKRSFSEPQRVSVTLSKVNYCLVNEFHSKLSCPLQRAMWRYYVDTNMPNDIQNHVVVSLDENATEPKKWDITEDCLAMNLPLVWKIIQKTHRELSLKGLVPVVMTTYGVESKKPAH